jgi:hypothetical protein
VVQQQSQQIATFDYEQLARSVYEASKQLKWSEKKTKFMLANPIEFERFL